MDEKTETPSLTPAPGNSIIIVSNDDIERGYPGHPELCAFARGAAKSIPGNRKVLVTHDGMKVFFGSNKGWKKYTLDRVVSEKIKDFDTTGKLKPFSWEFTL